jgi:SAM-dependent methyltransferase
VSGRSAPAGTAPSRRWWLPRLVRAAVRKLLGFDVDAMRADLEDARSTLEREARAREELKLHLEKRLDDTSAVIEDVRGAFLATRGEFEEIRDQAVPELAVRLGELYESAGSLQNEVVAVRDQRLPQAEQARTLLHTTAKTLQMELESLRDERLPRVENDLMNLQRAMEAVQTLAEELRDQRLPSLSARTDALVDRLHEDLSALGGMVDRVVQHEPLHVALEPEVEAKIPAAMAAASRTFMDTFRGERAEILGRAAAYLPLLAEAGPVLDLGCGRGELLEVLRDAGVEARGVDNDPAMVAACRTLGLAATEGDALETLRGQKRGRLGGVTALHVFEHLPAAAWMSIVEAATSALRSGGLLLVESPNPDSLRVGAGLFWVDPTHRMPVHPQAVAFVMRALGLEVVETRLVHPFPPEQALADASQAEPVRELAGKLDAWLSGPRDFMVLGRKP